MNSQAVVNMLLEVLSKNKVPPPIGDDALAWILGVSLARQMKPVTYPPIMNIMAAAWKLGAENE